MPMTREMAIRQIMATVDCGVQALFVRTPHVRDEVVRDCLMALQFLGVTYAEINNASCAVIDGMEDGAGVFNHDEMREDNAGE